MALLFCDGFDQYLNNPDLSFVYSGILRVTLNQEIVRNGQKSLALNPFASTSSRINHVHNLSLNECSIGLAIYCRNSIDEPNAQVSLRVAEGDAFIRIVAGGKILVFGNDVVLGTTSYSLPLNNWAFIEIYRKAGPNGVLQVFADGVLVFEFLGPINGSVNTTSIETLSDSGNRARAVYISDYYIADGPPLGNLDIHTIFPNSVDVNENWLSTLGPENSDIIDALTNDGEVIGGADSQLILSFDQLPFSAANVFGVVSHVLASSEPASGATLSTDIITGDITTNISNAVLSAGNPAIFSTAVSISPENGEPFTRDNFNALRIAFRST